MQLIAGGALKGCERIMSPEMWLIALGFVVGFFVGGLLGILTISMVVCGSRDDQARGL